MGFCGSNVIVLEPRRMEQVFPAVNEVEAYWTALKSDAPMPRRAAIDPRGIQGALHQAFVLERLAPGVARFRVAGIHLSDLMGMEVRGMPLTALFLQDSREAASAALDRAFTGPAKVTLNLLGDRGTGRGPLPARMILLPLLDDEGQVTRLLGALQAKGTVGRPPRRFAIVGQQFADIASAAPQPGLAEPQAPFRPAGRPVLRLVRDQDDDEE